VRRSLVVLFAVALSALQSGCDGRAATRPPVELTVFAAASLRDAFVAGGERYRADSPGVTLTFSFDASSALRVQIEQGAPVDVFASADTANPQALVDAGLTTGQVTPFARNRLAIVVPRENPAAIGDPRDLARPGVRIVGAGEAVPISKYVGACLEKLAALPGYRAGYAAAVNANVVSREDNVRAALTKVELGEADAAFVYVTDAAASDAVEVVAIPDAANVEALYGAVAIGASSHSAEAAAFVTWLAGPNGAAVLERFGFPVAAAG
jgi:molybdate transport system substrate-binding protein